MEKLIRDVISKVRGMYKYDMEYNKLLQSNPRIDIYLDEKEDTFVLRSLRFGTYDEICVYSDKIKYVSDDSRTERVLCEYESFEDLLNNI